MKSFITLIILFMILSIGKSQDLKNLSNPSIDSLISTPMTLGMFHYYEENKKDKSLGFLWSSVIPGGGLFYAENYGVGILYLALTAGDIVWISDPNESEKPVPIVIGLILRITELVKINRDIDDYNRKLRGKLNLSPFVSDREVGLRLKFNF